MIWDREPAAIVAAVMALVNVAVVFGLDLSDAQLAAIQTALLAVGTLIIRRQVTPVADPRLPPST